MFSKNGEKPINEGGIGDESAPISGKSAGIPSLISSDLEIIGDLRCAGDIQIDGKVEGNIKSKTVTVGEGAMVKGSIVADRATLLGSVNGEIKADQIIIAKTAKVVGDIIHRSLSVEAGAILDGHCRRFDTVKESKRDNAKIAPLKPTQPGGIIPNNQPKAENKPATG
ncbi:MAG: bactofilin family protein [Alphaproteobacteria bacterium]